MDLAVPFLVVASGLLGLAFDRKVANAIHCFGIASSERFPQWMRWPTTLPPRSSRDPERMKSRCLRLSAISARTHPILQRSRTNGTLSISLPAIA